MDPPDGPDETVDRVIVPVTGSADERDLQRRAAELAAEHDARLVAVHVRDRAPAIPGDLFGYLASACARHEIDFDADIVETDDAFDLGAGDLVVSSNRSSTDAPLARQVEELMRDRRDAIRTLELD